ncbi:MAG TPA: cytochrome c oxidase subunit II [Candidatus Megaira endosymbiont of Hartmannula sinica]|nr:cytochrome c oxidase subunit II [Candidatus Megaera endosymbiont of Hartmannula sinica]
MKHIVKLTKKIVILLNILFLNYCFIITNIYADKPKSWQFGFQEPASEIMRQLYDFHSFIMIILSSIIIFVLALLIYVIYNFHHTKHPVPNRFSHNLTVEIIWTLIPIIILIIIAIPSFRILKFAEEMPKSDLTVKVVGVQWYWNYSYPQEEIEFDSYYITDDKLRGDQIRLLDVDNRLVIPKGKVIKFLITSQDVIHSFAIPSLGIKTDAVPGKINQAWTKVDKVGVYYGQCSELCGVNHGFMPIAIEVMEQEDYEVWLKQSKQDFPQ